MDGDWWRLLVDTAVPDQDKEYLRARAAQGMHGMPVEFLLDGAGTALHGAGDGKCLRL